MPAQIPVPLIELVSRTQMPKLHPVWRYFHRKKEKGIGNDKHHHEARCKACIALHAQNFRAVVLNRAAENGSTVARTLEQIVDEGAFATPLNNIQVQTFTTVLDPIDPNSEAQQNEPKRFVGRVDTLLEHASTCTNMAQADRTQAGVWILEKQGEKENTPPSGHSTVRRTDSNATLVDVCASSVPTSIDGDLRALKYRKLDATRIVEVDTGVVYVACPAATPWTRERVERFNIMLCRLMIVCNIAWWAVENPYWRLFFHEWLPDVPMPGRRELSGQILDREAEKCVDEMRLHVGNKFATGQCDGWKDITKSSIVATMLNVEYTPWLANTADISRVPKNAESLLELVLDELRYAMEQLKVIVVAWCTDCSGESAKMRRLLTAKFKWMVSLDCWAHQINLVVGDMLKVSSFASSTRKALRMVKWFNNHSRALGMLREVTMQKLNQELNLILPCLTRWTSHYLSVRRLLQLERVFKQLVLDKEDELKTTAGQRNEAIEEARKIISMIKAETFWENLRSVKRHLEPLAIAANATQSDCARLDVVGVMVANLRYYFTSTPDLNPRAVAAVLESLDRRWAKVDQDIFILAIILNPFIRTSCFADGSPFRVPMLVWQLAEAAFLRFYSVAPCEGFRAQLIDYLTNRGTWTADGMNLKLEKQRAKAAGTEVNLINLWRLWTPISDACNAADSLPKDGTGQLALLATRILSMVPNSASVERVFSTFGFVHTKLRNRLSKAKVRKIVQVRLNTLRQFEKTGSSRKRTFGEMLGDTADTDEDSDEEAEQSQAGETSIANRDLAAELGEAAQAMQAEQERANEQDFETLIDELVDEAGLQADDEGGAPPRLDAIPPEARLLANLFKYPEQGDTSSRHYKVLTHYWRIGQRNLEREAQHQEHQYEQSRTRTA